MKYAVEIIGWTAATIMLSAYLLLTAGRLSSRAHTYHWLNLISSLGFIVNTAWNGAYPSMFINVVWAGIGLYGLLRPPGGGSDRSQMTA
jgi:hypothetical protein